MASEDNVHQLDQTQQPTAVVKGYRRKRTRNLDIVPHEGQEDPINASSPLYVDDVDVQKFNKAQREAVKAMGFGRFLELQIKVYPIELSYALLDNYNPMNSKLTLKNGLMVEITKDDVSTVLGFPHGTIGIERKKKKRVVSALLSTKFKDKLKAKDGEKLLFSWVD
nr:phospholipase-like protein [Ipomoea batatas]